jgi:hypothetical protein
VTFSLNKVRLNAILLGTLEYVIGRPDVALYGRGFLFCAQIAPLHGNGGHRHVDLQSSYLFK